MMAQVRLPYQMPLLFTRRKTIKNKWLSSYRTKCLEEKPIKFEYLHLKKSINTMRSRLFDFDLFMPKNVEILKGF